MATSLPFLATAVCSLPFIPINAPVIPFSAAAQEGRFPLRFAGQAPEHFQRENAKNAWRSHTLLAPLV